MQNGLTKFFLRYSKKRVDKYVFILYNSIKVNECGVLAMKLIKMRIVKSAEFENAMIKCQMSLGFIAVYKRTLVWIACFDPMDAEILRDELESIGSKYAGTWKM